jgi:hypothetical protein
MAEGDEPQAQHWFELAITTLDRVDDPYEAALPRLWAASLNLRRGEVREAVDLIVRALELLTIRHGPVGTALALWVTADVCTHFDRFSDSAVLVGAGNAVRGRNHMMVSRLEQQIIESAARELGNRLESNSQSGAALTEKDALAFAKRVLAEIQAEISFGQLRSSRTSRSCPKC